MGKLKNKLISTKAKNNKQPQVNDSKVQTKISNYFNKTNDKSSENEERVKKDLLVPNLKSFTSKQIIKSKSILSNGIITSKGTSSILLNNKLTKNKIKTSPLKSLNDSDIELIECTPDINTAKINSILSRHDDSIDFFPSTPHNTFENSKSIIKISDLSTNTSNENKNESLNKKLFTNKRIAESRTGISPNPKKSNNNYVENNLLNSYTHCKVNLLSKMEKSSSDISNLSDEESFSLLQTGLIEFKTDKNNEKSNCEYKTLDKNNEKSNDEFETLSKNNKSGLIEFNSDIKNKAKSHNATFHKIKSNNENIDEPEIILIDEFKSPERILKNNEYQKIFDTKNRYKVNKSIFEGSLPNDCEKIKNIDTTDQTQQYSLLEKNEFDDKINLVTDNKKELINLEELDNNMDITKSLNVCIDFDESLSLEFDKLSPFKEQKNENANNIIETNIISEIIDPSSYVAKGEYGRHIVLSVERDVYGRKIYLRLKCSKTNLPISCILSGFWYETAIKEGDILHILKAEYINDTLSISNEQGMVVVNPDYLLSGTSVVSGVFCRRKAVLNERCKGYEGGNKIMLIGSLLHQLFQEIVMAKDISEQKLDYIIENCLINPKILKEMYAQNLNENDIKKELKNFKTSILTWCNMYFNKGVRNLNGQVPKDTWDGQIESIEDIEENIWSPKYGIKGKIDLTVATSNCGKKVMPLELKTGKSSFSAEHKGQVILYSMMNSDRREDSGGGLLLYLKDGSMCEVAAGDKEKNGLIQLRNDLVSFLATRLNENNSSLPVFPEPLSNERMCVKCPHLLTCSALQKVTNTVPEAPHPMATLIPQALQHLKDEHLEYFRKWCLLLNLESGASWNSSSLNGLWCMDSNRREESADCLGDVVLDKNESVNASKTSSHFIHKFIRHKMKKKKLPLVFQTEDSVVVSSEKEIALSQGTVLSMEENSIFIALDRDLKMNRKWEEKIFRIDRSDYQYSTSTLFTNLAYLMQDNHRAEKLRHLIIDRKVPEFDKGLESGIVPKIKKFLKDLNKNQQRAVLRSLLSKDFTILKGYPGTGKTSTIVGLVRILHFLGKTVLITSNTHSAVDNILLKLKEYNEVNMLRLGKISRIHKDIQKFSDEFQTQDIKTVQELTEFYNSQKIVAAVCVGMGHPIFVQKTFDYCIMDEASQVLQAASLGPLFFCEKFILVGDSLQLPPVVRSNTARSLGMMESLFEYLDSAEGRISLVLQYRMNRPIMEVANYLSYEGQLQCAYGELETATLDIQQDSFDEFVDTRNPPTWILKCVSPSLDESVVLLDTGFEAPEIKDLNNQPTNPGETKIIIAIIKCFNKLGVPLNDIGIVTPYRAQVKLIRTMTSNLPCITGRGAIETNTVDQYQGRDKAVIIYSCVRSGLKPDQVKKGEILQDVRRLNVAITRARSKLIIVGDMKTLKLFEPFSKVLDTVKDSQKYELKRGKDQFYLDQLDYINFI